MGYASELEERRLGGRTTRVGVQVRRRLALEEKRARSRWCWVLKSLHQVEGVLVGSSSWKARSATRCRLHSRRKRAAWATRPWRGSAARVRREKEERGDDKLKPGWTVSLAQGTRR